MEQLELLINVSRDKLLFYLMLIPCFSAYSGGRRTGHVPYRDSKLTRILQPSLGGNSRTAIICTMSPALSHMEQSRNTLSFATRAKEVTNSAQVNMVCIVLQKGIYRLLRIFISGMSI